MTTSVRKSTQDYHIAWIAALPIERSAASEMLDETHEEPEDFLRNSTDQNSYDWGRVHGHSLVITSLPTGIYGKANAAHTITELLASLPHIKIALLVGIGAGLSSPQHDVQLGDVVVSQPDRSHGGVIQYDLGKANADGSWESKGFLQPPPVILLKALSSLQAKHESGQFRLTEFLSKAMERNKYWATRYARPPGIQSDRPTTDPVVHFGTIASGDTLIKNALVRNDIPAKIRQDCLCIEMEAAGLLSKFPCMVVRGICDHADSHKNDDWQRYASATAAAFAKELLLYVPEAELSQTRKATDLMGLQKIVEQLKQSIEATQQDAQTSKAHELLRALYTCPYTERKDRNISALEGTCQWFVQHRLFLNWNSQADAGLLWVSADPGCGKSVLAKYLIDKVLCVYKDQTICYFFFKDEFLDQRSCSNAMCALLRQLLIQRPELQQEEVLLKFAQDGKKLKSSFKVLWELFLKLSASLTTGVVICVLDALDECQQPDRAFLIQAISQSYSQIRELRVKFLITSRPYGEIKDIFYRLTVEHPTIHLSGESELEAEQISDEIGIVIKHRIHLLSRQRSLTLKEETYLVERFTSVPHRTYLWAYLTMNVIETTPGLTKGRLEQVLGRLPQTVHEVYEKILDRSSDIERTRLLLQILVAAQRPMSLQEVSIFLCIQEHHQVDDFADVVEPPFRFKQSVRDLCGLFVIVVNDQVYFLHQTAREFLVQNLKEPNLSHTESPGLVKNSGTWAASIPLAISHSVLAERCLWYMFTAGAQHYDKGSFEYCNKFWALHFARADPFSIEAPQTELALRVFTAWTSCYKTLPLEIRRFHGFVYCYPDIKLHLCSPIVFAAFFGCLSVVRLILKRTPSRQMRIRTASCGLWWAVLSGNLQLIRLLLSVGANPNTNCYGDLESTEPANTIYWFTPLTIAIKNWHTKTVRLLVEEGADVNMLMPGLWNTAQYITPLGLATSKFDKSRADSRKVDILATLLLHGADPIAQCYDSEEWSGKGVLTTPLQFFLTTPYQLFEQNIANICPSIKEKQMLLGLFSRYG